ncbi:MAG: CDP-alcohol phosphatidyltransferase family protein [Candidatus Binatia bacterium]
MRRSTEKKGIGAWILTEPNQPVVKVWGLSIVERLRRALCAAGVPREQIGIGPASQVSARESRLLIFRSDYVCDERLIHALVAAEDTVLVASRTLSGHEEAVAVHMEGARLAEALYLLRSASPRETAMHEAGLRCVTPAELAPAYIPSLRRADLPYLLPARSENVAEIESRIFKASYKGVTDLVTKWIWPLPARAVTRYLARAGVHPNAVTLLSWVLVGLTAILLIYGQFGLGLAAAWLMTFLDTVDGKLARVTLTSSQVGHVLDHGLDLLHPPFWYLAWAIGLLGWQFNNVTGLGLAAAITIGGYVVGRLIEGIFLLVFKMEIHCWQPIDSFFRTITARRNPNLLLLTAGTLIGRPDVGLILVAVWTVCSIGFHTVRLAQAFLERHRGYPVQTWQEAAEGA